jgi:hypothetical protein
MVTSSRLKYHLQKCGFCPERNVSFFSSLKHLISIQKVKLIISGNAAASYFSVKKKNLNQMAWKKFIFQ